MFFDSNANVLTVQKVDSLFNTITNKNYGEYMQTALQYLQISLRRDPFYNGICKRNFASKEHLVQANPEEQFFLNQALSRLQELYLDHTIAFQQFKVTKVEDIKKVVLIK